MSLMMSIQRKAAEELSGSWITALHSLTPRDREESIAQYLAGMVRVLDAISTMPQSEGTKKAETKLRQACFAFAREFPGLALVGMVAYCEENRRPSRLALPRGVQARIRLPWTTIAMRWDGRSHIAVTIGRQHGTVIPVGKAVPVDPYILGAFNDLRQAEKAFRERMSLHQCFDFASSQ